MTEADILRIRKEAPGAFQLRTDGTTQFRDRYGRSLDDLARDLADDEAEESAADAEAERFDGMNPIDAALTWEQAKAQGE